MLSSLLFILSAAVPECERLVPALTSQDRTSWAKAREEFFSLGVNKETLQHLESAVLFVSFFQIVRIPVKLVIV